MCRTLVFWTELQSSVNSQLFCRILIIADTKLPPHFSPVSNYWALQRWHLQGTRKHTHTGEQLNIGVQLHSCNYGSIVKQGIMGDLLIIAIKKRDKSPSTCTCNLDIVSLTEGRNPPKVWSALLLMFLLRKRAD